MSEDMKRRYFLELSAGAAALAIVPGCPADDDDDTGADSTSTGPSTSSPSTTDNPTTTNATTTTDTTTTASTTTEGTESGSTESSTTDDPTIDPTTGPESSGPSDSSGSSDESSSTGAPGECDHDPDVAIPGNHPAGMEHILIVPLEDVMAGVQVVYDITGNSAHSHTVTVSAADFAVLAAGGSVDLNSSFDFHMHSVTITCE